MTCPQCQSQMTARPVGNVSVHQCGSCKGIFLERADVGLLAEAETDYHRDSGHITQPLPRITEDMVAPPPKAPGSRSYIETLFG